MHTTESVTKSISHQPFTACTQKYAAVKSLIRSTTIGVFGLLSTLPVSQVAHAQTNFVAPAVFQAAGPTAASIQGTVDAFRAALGDPNNGNNPGPLSSGRREINWDGGDPNIMDTTAPVTPFNVFQNTRGAQFTTPGTGLSQATPTGFSVLFNNPTYATIFTTFSPSRLFSPVGSNVTNGLFFVPGTNGASVAAVSGFGAVFSDVDLPDGGRPHKASTQIECFDRSGKRIFRGAVPASPGSGSLSFLGVQFSDARIASIRITTDVAPGVNDDRENDIVVMDDFIFGEPQLLQ